MDSDLASVDRPQPAAPEQTAATSLRLAVFALVPMVVQIVARAFENQGFLVSTVFCVASLLWFGSFFYSTFSAFRALRNAYLGANPAQVRRVAFASIALLIAQVALFFWFVGQRGNLWA